tara:strand:+ start:1375 stop:1857 length:483 start_codon:yes stop_codon:yes gene_type:complete
MKYYIILFFIVQVCGFKNIFRKSNHFHLLKDSNNEPNNEPRPKEIKILDIDFESLVNFYDQQMINSFNGNIPSAPQSEDEIEEDSFEGYLRTHFDVIKNNDNRIDFNMFFLWRKQIGTVLTINELFEIYNTIVEKDEDCDLMKFILLNKIIDENDGADFS